jgi:hypothetical protein
MGQPTLRSICSTAINPKHELVDQRGEAITASPRPSQTVDVATRSIRVPQAGDEIVHQLFPTDVVAIILRDAAIRSCRPALTHHLVALARTGP